MVKHRRPEEYYSNTPENWKPIEGHPGYEVSDQGRVRSLSRRILVEGKRKPHWKSWKGRILRPQANYAGYLHVHLGQTDQHQISALVLAAFVGPQPKGMVRAHNNGKNNDNRLVNLRYATHYSNQQDRVKHGTHHRGERSPFAILTEAMVRQIRASDEPRTVLAERFGVSLMTITQVRRRASWSWLE